jgi:hypothetical protein
MTTRYRAHRESGQKRLTDLDTTTTTTVVAGNLYRLFARNLPR